MNLAPITPSPFKAPGIGYQVRCNRCGKMQHPMFSAADVDHAFEFICWEHWPVEDEARITAAYAAAFQALSEEEQQRVRAETTPGLRERALLRSCR